MFCISNCAAYVSYIVSENIHFAIALAIGSSVILYSCTKFTLPINEKIPNKITSGMEYRKIDNLLSCYEEKTKVS